MGSTELPGQKEPTGQVVGWVEFCGQYAPPGHTAAGGSFVALLQ